MQKNNASKRFVGIIPARGGSVGLPKKNLMEVQGISLIARAVLIAKMIKEIEWIIVSTNDKEIAMEAERAGASIPFLRPENLAREDTPMVSVLEHALSWFRSSIADADYLCDGVVLLQPTSPMRKTEHVIGAINLYASSGKDGTRAAGVHTVSPVPKNSAYRNLWRQCDREVGQSLAQKRFVRNKKTEEIPNRVQLYYRNGAAVVLDHHRLKALTLAEKQVLPYIINEPIVTIDTLYDLLYTEYYQRRLEPDPVQIGWKSFHYNN